VTIFTFTIEYDQAINHSFDQDDVKTVGKRRVSATVVVVAPDKVIAELFLQRNYHYYAMEIKDCQITAINYLIDVNHRAFNAGTSVKPIGPEVIDPRWKEAVDRDSRGY
jgi:hypothetical protein